MKSKYLFLFFAIVFLAGLGFISGEPGTCACYAGADTNNPFICSTSTTIYNPETGELCEDGSGDIISGYNACSAGFRPACGANMDIPCTGSCGGCVCEPVDDFPAGISCYDLLDILGMKGGCTNTPNVPPLPAKLITEVEGAEVLYDYYATGGGIGHSYCWWEDRVVGPDGGLMIPTDDRWCVACPEGMIWNDGTQACQCDPASSCSPGSTCLSESKAQVCNNVNGCTVYQTVKCNNGFYCPMQQGGTSCVSCPTSSNNVCASSECMGVDPDCGCYNDNGACGVGCDYTLDDDCSVPLNVQCAPLACDKQTKAGCFAIDPDSVCISDGVCCPHEGCTTAQDPDCGNTSSFSYSQSGVLNERTGSTGNKKASYVYDLFNRLISSNTVTGGIENYFYDSSGKRVKKVSPTETTYYLNFGNDVLYTDSQELSCSEACSPCHGNPHCNGFVDVLDVVSVVSVAFRNGQEVTDPGCPKARTDVDCNGKTDVIDVVKFTDVAFRGGDPSVKFCNACDNYIPPVIVTLPGLTPNQNISANTKINATLSDISNVHHVNFYIVKVDGGNIYYQDTSPPYEYYWNLSGFTAGQYKISASAHRASGYELGRSVETTVTLPEFPNLVLNPGFEDVVGNDILNWRTRGDETDDRGFIVTDNCHSGKCSKVIRPKAAPCDVPVPPGGYAGGGWVPMQENILLEPNTNYTLNFWAKAEVSNGVLVEMTTRNASDTGWIYLFYCSSSVSGEWKKISCDNLNRSANLLDVAPSRRTADGRIKYTINTLASDGTCPIFNYLDDVEVRRKYYPSVTSAQANAIESQPVPATSGTETQTNQTNQTCVPELVGVTCGSAVCGTKINNCNQIVSCGVCQESYSCIDGACVQNEPISTACSDGTQKESCSILKPLYCDAQLELVKKCDVCGCSTGTCREDGSCLEGVTIEKKKTSSAQLGSSKTSVTAQVIKEEEKSFISSVAGFFKRLFSSKKELTGDVITEIPSVITIKEGVKNADGTIDVEIHGNLQRSTAGIQFNVVYDASKITNIEVFTPTNFLLYKYKILDGKLLVGMYDGNGEEPLPSGAQKIATLKVRTSSQIYSNMLNINEMILADAQTLDEYEPIQIDNKLPIFGEVIRKPKTGTTSVKGSNAPLA